MRTFLPLLLIAATIAGALAEPYSPTNLEVVNSSSRALPQSGDGTIEAQGGNVSEVHIEAIAITQSWQGYFGNITGNLLLDDGSNQTFYSWGNVSVSGEVFAARTDAIDWASINCTNGTVRAQEEIYLNKSTLDGDSVLNTFNSTSHPSFLVGLTNVTQDSCYSTNAYVNNGPQTSSFYQILLADDDQNIVYSTILEDDEAAFNGNTVDFQLLVAENGKAGFDATTTYYFFVELS